MKVDKFYLQTHTNFGKSITEWANELNVEVLTFHERDLEDIGTIDGLVIFTENQTIEKDISEIRAAFDLKQKPIQKIDINGTLVAGVSNFTFWLERNNCKNILCIGSDNLLKNTNLERLLTSLKK